MDISVVELELLWFLMFFERCGESSNNAQDNMTGNTLA
jgi:hypothetical protein